PAELQVLDGLVGLVPALVVVDLAARPREGQGIPPHDLVDGEQLVLPSELAVPRSLEGYLVDEELELAVEVVLVPWGALDHPEATLGQAGGTGRRPGDALPVLVHVADVRNVGPVGVPVALVDPPRGSLPRQVGLLRNPQLVGVAHELPLEVLDLAVEERAVVLALVRTEEPVGAVRGRRSAHATQRRHEGPGGVVLLGFPVAP